jgi:hypothetical protein
MSTPAAALAALAKGDVAVLAAQPALAAALLLLTLLVAVLLARLLAPRGRREAVLLLGPCGAGKTALFGRVSRGRCFQRLQRPSD